jgi:hypothetical protein
MKDQRTKARTCLGQACQACRHCIWQNKKWGSDTTNEWVSEATLLHSRHNATLQPDERLRLDNAIEAATLAG